MKKLLNRSRSMMTGDRFLYRSTVVAVKTDDKDMWLIGDDGSLHEGAKDLKLAIALRGKDS